MIKNVCENVACYEEGVCHSLCVLVDFEMQLLLFVLLRCITTYSLPHVKLFRWGKKKKKKGHLSNLFVWVPSTQCFQNPFVRNFGVGWHSDSELTCGSTSLTPLSLIRADCSIFHVQQAKGWRFCSVQRLIMKSHVQCYFECWTETVVFVCSF